jgi:hypothetical protein
LPETESRRAVLTRKNRLRSGVRLCPLFLAPDAYTLLAPPLLDMPKRFMSD